MMWDDMAARARGLASHLLGREELDRVERAPGLHELGHILERAGYPVLSAAATPSARGIERAARRRAAADLAVLDRWAGERAAALAVLFEDEDRRSLRAILRGVVAGAAAEERMASLIPTPALGEAALAELSRQPTPAAVAALLLAWQNPYAAAFAEEATRSRPDLFAVERSLDRRYAERALVGARRGGEAVLRHVRSVLDAENAFAALALASGHDDVDPAEMHVPGGARLGPDTFLEAVAAGSDGVRRVLARAFAGTGLGHALEGGLSDLESVVLADQIDEQRRVAHLWPSGPAQVILFVLRRRAEIRSVTEAAWRASLTRREAG